MADNILIPATGSGDATPSVGTYEDAGNDHIQRMVTHGPDPWQANSNQSTAQTDTVLKAAGGASTYLCVCTLVISTDTAMNVTLVENTASSTDIAGPFYFAANGGMAITFSPPLILTVNDNLGYTSSASGNHTVIVTGYLI